MFVVVGRFRFPSMATINGSASELSANRELGLLICLSSVAAR
jgi:hypothetical protein